MSEKFHIKTKQGHKQKSNERKVCKYQDRHGSKVVLNNSKMNIDNYCFKHNLGGVLISRPNIATILLDNVRNIIHVVFVESIEIVLICIGFIASQ